MPHKPSVSRILRKKNRKQDKIWENPSNTGLKSESCFTDRFVSSCILSGSFLPEILFLAPPARQPTAGPGTQRPSPPTQPSMRPQPNPNHPLLLPAPSCHSLWVSLSAAPLCLPHTKSPSHATPIPGLRPCHAQSSCVLEISHQTDKHVAWRRSPTRRSQKRGCWHNHADPVEIHARRLAALKALTSSFTSG